MQFARSNEGGYQQYAIKFFLNPADFPVESQLYEHARVRRVLPKLLFAADNSDRAYVSHSGFQFPPFLVMERGSSLCECAPAASCGIVACMQLRVRSSRCFAMAVANVL